MSRGMITESVLDVAKETLGKEISQKELRLMPYIFTCAIDGQNIDVRKIDNDEQEIMKQWKELGWIESPASDFRISEHFFNAVSKIMWVAYVKAECMDME